MHQLKKGETNCLISVGAILKNVMETSIILSKKKINHSVYDLRFVKPLNKKNLNYLVRNYKKIFIIEEHYENGGAYSYILEEINKLKNVKTKIFSLGIKNQFIKFCGNQENARELTGLDPKSIFRRIKKNI